MNRLEDIILKNCGPLSPIPTETKPQLEKLDGVKAVLFDVYGTLIISGSGDVGTATATDTAEALTQALVVSGFEGEAEQAGVIGKEMMKAEIQEWHKAGHEAGADFPEVEITKIWTKIIANLSKTETLRKHAFSADQIRRLGIEYECRVNPVFPMPGCKELLNGLKERGLPMGIVSNAQYYTPIIFSAFFERALEEIGFDPECCIWSYKELKAKPSADLFPKAGKFLEKNHGIKLSETVYVGNDMLNDIYTAQQAGCKTVLFAGDKRSLRLRETDDRCKNLKPDAVITSLNQLLEMI
ncbi:HAD family hydrolase [Pontiella agarivorans]|uniref:HAD family hydrolase n=1 Tax=Pontiella agarivorans TaxID=3038953 RepID=A0ABU5MW25_9BACT|nr:HAD family hydrolase [Pontiella agarivorans]MDZ8118429.1 HAD family hydrolase [Pontiella agarivorans]